MRSFNRARAPDDHCRLLELPAELRDLVFQYSFATDSGTVKFVNALASYPSSALLATCQQIYQEAGPFYKPAAKQYWQDTSFTFEDTSGSPSVALNALCLTLEKDIAPQSPTLPLTFPWHMIQHVVLHKRAYSFCFVKGLWRTSSPKRSRELRMLFVQYGHCNGFVRRYPDCAVWAFGGGPHRTFVAEFPADVPDHEVQAVKKRIHPESGLLDKELRAVFDWDH